jgi:serine/threonine protein kinase
MLTGGLEDAARKICRKHHMKFVGTVGEGAFKQTFHVVDSSNTPLALKIYKAENASPRDHREINAMRKCSHKNIAKLLSVETFKDGNQKVVAITEEFLSGGTLTSKGQLDVRKCLSVGSQLVDALGHIARLNLVHRDIKPDNIIFRSDGLTPVLSDFGVVRDLTDSSITPTWAARGPGTPFFSAPEQLINQKSLIDWRTDQFALGISLAVAVFAEHPYRNLDITDEDLLQRVSSRLKPAEWFVEQTVASGLSALLKMVAPWPIDRYRKPENLRASWAAQKG